jgi:hypothetical protein
MAALTPLDEKLGEVVGLAQAAQDATKTVGGMEGAEDFESDLERMREQAAETERRTDELVDGLERKIGGEEEALDGFELSSMAEAGELCHWEIVERMAKTIDAGDVHRLATWAVEIQREHVEGVRRASLALAEEEIRESVGA